MSVISFLRHFRSGGIAVPAARSQVTAPQTLGDHAEAQVSGDSRPVDREDKVIQRLDNLETSLKSHVSAEVSRVSAELAETFAAGLRRLTAILETLPESTRREIEPLFGQLARARTPLAVRTVTEEISKKVSSAVSDVIDAALLNVLREEASVTNHDLVAIALERGICSRASVFRHLQQLETAGRVSRKRQGKAVYYSLHESQVSGISERETYPPVTDTSH